MCTHNNNAKQERMSASAALFVQSEMPDAGDRF